MGADGVELDARRTRDDVLVVHHDAEVDGLRTHRASTTRAAVRDAATARSRRSSRRSTRARGCSSTSRSSACRGIPIPTRADHEVVRAVVEARASERDRHHRVVVRLDAVDAVRSFAAELTTAWLTSGQTVVDAATTRGASTVMRGCNPDRESALRASAADIAAAHDAGVRVNVWTVDDPDEIRRLAAVGVDAIITNVPDVALAALAE